MTHIKYLALTAVLLLFGDIVWFKIAGSFFKEQIGTIARLENGNLSPRLGAAAGVYILMTLSCYFFVFFWAPPETAGAAWARGAFLGLSLYGVYDLTNRAILETYPIPMAAVDMAWGTFLFSTVAVIVFQARKIF